MLVVEDEPDIATTLEHILTRERFHVRVAENGEDALQDDAARAGIDVGVAGSCIGHRQQADAKHLD